MLKTAEFCSPMHPDKICDRISDAVLDACLVQDPLSRVAIETMGGHGIVTITGELTTNAYIDIRSIVQRIAGPNVGIQINIVQQSPEIANGVDNGGAGDQGIMVGYSTNENEAMIPQELYLARSLCEFLYKIQPEDGKVQITLKEGFLFMVVASWANTTIDELEKRIEQWIEQTIGFDNTKLSHIYANCAGEWTQSGFEADTGLTGRKLACDNYGPQIPIGGGAFSGKDATKVDRSGAYMARKLAVQFLKTMDFQKPIEVLCKLAYVIGVANPIMVTMQYRYLDSNEPWTNVAITREQTGELKPSDLIYRLQLDKPIYENLATWGHFGRKNLPWETEVELPNE